jgi:hypothetical protein
VNFCLTCPLCCRMPGAMNLKCMPKPAVAHASLSAVFLPALLQRIYSTTLLYLEASSLIKGIIFFYFALLCVRKKIQHMPVQSSRRMRSQNFALLNFHL